MITTKLRELFCRYGAPETLVTDNGPQFISDEFKDLMKEFNTHHRRVTPYHPMANGEVERFNRSLKKCIQTAISQGLDWRTALQNFLLNYRNTEHATTGATPAELFFKRQLRDKLPSKKTTQQSKASKIAISTDKARKAASKCYIDEKCKACEHNIQVGQKVLVTNTAKH